MSLIRLLAVGRTLGLVRDERSPYKMARQGLLPRFESQEKPNERKAPLVGAMNNSPRARANDNEINRAKNMNEPRTNPPAAAAAPRTAPQRFPLGRWTPVTRSPFRSAGPAAGVAPVQAELSLDLVKPVRNDLADADLVVVPGQSVAEGAGLTATTVPSRPSAPVWSRWKAQLFGAGEP